MFVTWRLYGSLPKDTPLGGKFAVVDRQLDLAATGPQWLADEQVAQCVWDALAYGEKQLELYRLRACEPCAYFGLSVGTVTANY